MSKQSIVINLSAPKPPTSSHRPRQALKSHKAADPTPKAEVDRKPLSQQEAADDARDSDCLSFWSDSMSSTCDPTNLSPKSPTSHQPVDAKANSSQRCNTTKTRANRSGSKKRVTANERERERTKSLNQALEILRNKLPLSIAEKRSKIQTLRAAKQYIEFLAQQNNEHSTPKILDEDQTQAQSTSLWCWRYQMGHFAKTQNANNKQQLR